MDKAQIEEALLSYVKELDAESKRLARVSEDYAQKENAYRMSKAQAFIVAGITKDANGRDKMVDQKRCEMDLACERQRIEAHIAEGMKEATKERIRALMAIVNSYQTIAAFEREEMRLAR